MNLYYAPLESITGYPLRNTHHRLFPGIEKYYSPFLSANESGKFTGREGRDIAVENNTGIPLVPQILGKNVEHVLWSIEKIHGLGYREININMGCPSGTVTAKGKGAGMLRSPVQLDRFLEELFEGLRKRGLEIDSTLESQSENFSPRALAVSIKTRLGISEIEETRELVKVFQSYPLAELTVHARFLKDMYRRPVNLEGFEIFYQEYKGKLVYNGDVQSLSDYEKIVERFPNLEAIMLGRGLVGNPALARVLRGGDEMSRAEIKEYLSSLLTSYQDEISGEKNILHKMKENWAYLSQLFPDAEREIKEIRKAKNLAMYKAATRGILTLMEEEGGKAGEC